MSRKPLTVIMLSEYPFDEAEQSLGGIMQSTYQLVEGFKMLAPADMRLEVVTLSPKVKRETQIGFGTVTIHFLPKGSGIASTLLLNPARLLNWLRMRRSKGPVLLHGQGTVTYLVLSLLMSSNSIQTIHGIYRNENKTIPRASIGYATRLRFWLKEVAEGAYMRRIRNLIAITNEVTSTVMATGNGAFRAFPINNCVDIGFFNSHIRPLSKGDAKQTLNLLFVAAITPRKGLHVLLSAFDRLASQHPHLRLYVVGPADWAPDYVAQMQTQFNHCIKAGRLIFTGAVSRDRLIALYRDADIFTLPSFAESAPMVISQALCAGLPVVSTTVGGIPEMIDQDQTGILVAPGDADALASALERLIQNPELRNTIAAAAERAGIQRYHPRSIAAATREAYMQAAQPQIFTQGDIA